MSPLPTNMVRGSVVLLQPTLLVPQSFSFTGSDAIPPTPLAITTVGLLHTSQEGYPWETGAPSP